MKFAYADPPYLGCCAKYEHFHGDGGCWDDLSTHAALIERLGSEYPDGWVLSLHAPSLRDILPLCPPDTRVAAWCKSWHQIRPKVPVQYSWEPVLFRSVAKDPQTPMVRDWIVLPATKQRGTIGAKPDPFTHWVLGLLGFAQGDTLDDLFVGSGGVARTVERWSAQTQMGLVG